MMQAVRMISVCGSALALLWVMPLHAAIQAPGSPVKERPAIASVEELVGQGMAYNAAKRYDAALIVFRQAAALAPDNAFVMYNLGTALGMAKRYQEGADALRKSVALSPDLQPAWANLGAMYNHLNQPVEALAAFRQVLRLNPQDSNAHYQSGVNLLHLGKTVEASIEEEELRATNPDLADELLQQILAVEQQQKQ